MLSAGVTLQGFLKYPKQVFSPEAKVHPKYWFYTLSHKFQPLKKLCNQIKLKAFWKRYPFLLKIAYLAPLNALLVCTPLDLENKTTLLQRFLGHACLQHDTWVPPPANLLCSSSRPLSLILLASCWAFFFRRHALFQRKRKIYNHWHKSSHMGMHMQDETISGGWKSSTQFGNTQWQQPGNATVNSMRITV